MYLEQYETSGGRRRPWGAVVTHQAANMAVMERGTEGLGLRVCGVNDARNMGEDNLVGSFPFLEGKMLDVNMTSTRRWTTRIYHQDCSSVILEQRSRTNLRVPKFREDRPKVLGNLGEVDSSEEFGVCGAGGNR